MYAQYVTRVLVDRTRIRGVLSGVARSCTGLPIKFTKRRARYCLLVGVRLLFYEPTLLEYAYTTCTCTSVLVSIKIYNTRLLRAS